MNIAAIDIVFGSLILIFTVRCALKGFIAEFMSVAAFVLALLCALFFFKPGAEFVRTALGMTTMSELIAFVGLFLIVFVLVKILERILGDIVDRVNMDGVDRFLGMLLGAVEGLLVVAIAVFILSVQPLFDASALLSDSIFAHYLLPFVSAASRSAQSAAGRL